MTATTQTATAFGARLGGLLGLGLLASVAAAVATVLAAVAMQALGADYAVDGGEIPVGGFGSVAFGCSVVGLVLAAALLRWSARPDHRFLQVAVGLTALSLVPPVLWGRDIGTTLALVVLHLVAAVVMVPSVVRLLRTA